MAENTFDHKIVEEKWQKKWEETKVFEIKDLKKVKNKFYLLVMFPYPSSQKLHIGHWYNYAPADTYGRYKRMLGYDVFEPIGFDAFGLPAENYAVKTGIHPAITTEENVNYIREQLKKIGAMFDFSREVNSSKPEYYKWTQWIFVQLFKKGLAYRKKAPVNWCPSCKTVLANEQVIDGKCERCGTPIEKKFLTQWFLKITDYADKLLEGLRKIEWPEKTKKMQENWIGRSEGSVIKFKVDGMDEYIEVFTTRADTLMGVTYIVLAPEHELVEKITTEDRKKEVEEYVKKAINTPEIERTNVEKEKTGVFTGAYAIHPLNGRKVPIWVADYVLGHYGTGAVMAVPAHDQRDWEFAKKFGLDIIQVIKPIDNSEWDFDKGAFEEYGVLVNSGEFDNLTSVEAKKRITQKLKSLGLGDFKVSYRLKDWLISRQRFWGPPIPIIYCPNCGVVPEKEENLPVMLPMENIDFKPRGDGKSPLATHPTFKHTKCPYCGADAERELDTMDTFMCSSWYYLRYLSPHLDDKPWDEELEKMWLPVDQYIGGAEHATMHLLYARFIYKALHDMGYVSHDEPFQRLYHQGIITKDGAKMSKSRGNVVNPEEYVERYGSDTFRMYMMFMGEYSEGGDWNDNGIAGMRRFLDRVYRLVVNNSDKISEMEFKNLDKKLHKTIKKVREDLERFHFNTAIAAMMELLNEINDTIREYKEYNIKSYLKEYVKLLASFAPHLAEELWEILGGEYSVFNQKYPEYDENLIKDEDIQIVIQVNGKVRSRIMVEANIDDEKLKELALNDERIKRWTKDKNIVKVIVVPKKLVNIVVR